MQVLITVINDQGQKGTAGPVEVLFPPNVSSVSPMIFPAEGGVLTTITGTDLGRTVLFGEKPATDVQLSEDRTSLTCVSPSFL